MSDDYRHADEWLPDPSRSAEDWLLDGLEREDHYGPYRFVRLYGTAYEPARLPDGVQPGRPRCCFANAFRLAAEQPELHYVEGFGTLWGCDTWLYRHAWCIDDDGHVVDPSWGADEPLPLALRGLVLPIDLVEPYCFDESGGTLDEGLWDQLGVIAQRLGVKWPA